MALLSLRHLAEVICLEETASTVFPATDEEFDRPFGELLSLEELPFKVSVTKHK